MPLDRLPDVPDPTKIAQAGAELAKVVSHGAVDVGVDVAEGLRQILFQTVEGGVKEVDQTIKEVVSIVKRDVETGKTTVDKVRMDVDRTFSSLRSQVDQAIGGEVVRKFKSEIERQLR